MALKLFMLADAYKPGQVLKFIGRTWIVTAVAHTNKYIVIATNDGLKFRKHTVQLVARA